MNTDRWERLAALCGDALDRPEDARRAFLEKACAGDAELLREATSLLQQHDPVFLERPVLRVSQGAGALDATEDVRVGPYRIVRPLGRGGMGEVFLAIGGGEDFRQSVAIKLVREGVNTEDVLRRFRGERRILASLSHPNIAKLLDGGATEAGDPYFVMEYVDGAPIDVFADREQLSIRDRLHVMQNICDAVQHAHRNLIVHRDIKPTNILVTNDGVPKLLDFGIGKVLDSSAGDALEQTTRMFTPRYASPEQLSGESLTTATDVFSLGVVLYELLSGMHPYDVAPDGEIGPKEIERVPPPSAAVDRISGLQDRVRAFTARRGVTPLRIRRALAGDLDRIVMKAMHVEPTRRYTSPGALGDDLQRYLDGRPVLARPDSLAYRTRRFVQRNPWAAVASGLAAAAIGLAIGFPAAAARQMEAERDRALEVQNFLLEIFGASGAGLERGDTLTAGNLLDRQAGVLESEYGDRPELHAAMRVVLAEGYERLGLYARAAEHAATAVQLYRDRGKDELADLAAALNLLGWTQFRLGSVDTGEVYLREAVALRRRLGDATARELARSLNDLAVLFESRGWYDSAGVMHSEAMTLRRELLGPEHRATAVSASNLAVIHYRQGDLEEATRLGEFAVQGLEAALGPAHQRTVIATQNLATYRAASGDLEGARDVYLDLLERQTRIQGRDHPVTVGIRVSAAVLLRRLGDHEAAIRLIEEALASYERQFGPVHERVASTLESLGAAIATARGVEEAGPIFERAVQTMAQTLGAVNPKVADVHVTWGEQLRDHDDYLAAAEQFRRGVEVYSAALEPDHFRTLDARLRLAHALRQATRWPDAAAQYATLHDALLENDPRDWIHQVRVGWAATMAMQGEPARADSILAVVREFVDTGDPPASLTRFLESTERMVGNIRP